MPYKNAAQRAAMHIHAPDVAAKWDKKYGGKIGGRKKPKKASEAVKKRAAGNP